MPTENELHAAFDAGVSSAQAVVAESDMPLFLADELRDDELSIAHAKGWNSVWAAERNRHQQSDEKAQI